jgi:hypothetical protein
MRDPEFLREAEAAKIEVDPVRGIDLQKVVEQVLMAPQDVRERARKLIE